MAQYVYRCTQCGITIERAYPVGGAPRVYVDRCSGHEEYSNEFRREGLHEDDQQSRGGVHSRSPSVSTRGADPAAPIPPE